MDIATITNPRTLAELEPDGLLDLLIEAERAVRRAEGARYRVLSALERHPIYRRVPIADAASEVACALRISERAAQGQVADAHVLSRLFPETLDRLAAGDVQGVQVRALIETTSALSEAAARAVQDRVLPLMPQQNPAATRKALTRAVLKADPDGAWTRHEHARKDRRVAHYPECEGMSTLAATLPAEQAVHAMAALTAHARAAKQQNPEDERTLDQARADTLYHLITGNTQTHPPAHVNITVPLDTLLGVSEEPGDLDGYGPITAHTVRALAAQSDSSPHPTPACSSKPTRTATGPPPSYDATCPPETDTAASRPVRCLQPGRTWTTWSRSTTSGPNTADPLHPRTCRHCAAATTV
jgi:hypothetical protein